MKPTLAFTGALLVAFATGVLLTKAIDTNVGTSLSHPNLSLTALGNDAASSAGDGLIAGFAPDWGAVERETGVFVPNLGQVRHDVYFQFIGANQVAHFRSTSIGIQDRARAGLEDARLPLINVRFVGANSRPEVRATNQSASRFRYSAGESAGRFTASVPLFSELTYGSLYDGIDLSVLASEPSVRRVFTLRPGADASQLLFHYDGANDPVLSESATLTMETPIGVLSYEAPIAFQVRAGRRQAVPISYRMGRYGAFGFSVGAYDKSLPLVIEVDGI